MSSGSRYSISMRAPTERFRANEARIVAALRKAAKSAAWTR
jgi:hypothetical protein